MDRLLIYTCCDETYYMFIPLFCLSHLMYNDNADIEIGICSESLPKDIEDSLTFIREKYKNSKIQIDYSAFVFGIYGGKRVINNTMRFIIEPKLRDKYVYITDIDIVCCESIYECHIKDMIEHDSNYSNMVRKGTNRMTGLHFSLYSAYYPVIDKMQDIDITDNDEIVLYNIVKKDNYIDLSRDYRPVHGIHMSLNRDKVGGTTYIPGWGADRWKEVWYDICSTDEYKYVYSLFSDRMKAHVAKLNDYYEK